MNKMSIINPSQYDCDNSQKGDLILVKPRPLWYKWYRKNFQKDKIILKVRKDWNSEDHIDVYQEDCTLIFNWEIQSRCDFKDEVPYYVGIDNKYLKHGKYLSNLQFGSENISIVLKSGLSVLIPTSYIRDGIRKLDEVKKSFDDNRQIQEALKFAKYKGDFFEKRCKELNLKEWSISYCNVCGKPINIKFDKDVPYVENECDCGNMKVEDEDITWDTVAYWYNRQILKPCINKYKEFWKI